MPKFYFVLDSLLLEELDFVDYYLNTYCLNQEPNLFLLANYFGKIKDHLTEYF